MHYTAVVGYSAGPKTRVPASHSELGGWRATPCCLQHGEPVQQPAAQHEDGQRSAGVATEDRANDCTQSRRRCSSIGPWLYVGLLVVN